jgi:hypothetical protein
MHRRSSDGKYTTGDEMSTSFTALVRYRPFHPHGEVGGSARLRSGGGGVLLGSDGGSREGCMVQVDSRITTIA